MSRHDVIAGMCFLLPWEELRTTPSVEFYEMPESLIKDIGAVDRVRHSPGAKSPMVPGDQTHYWYMHPDQEDNLIVFQGKRIVELYTVAHGKIETFEVTPERVTWGEEVIHEGPCVFGWPTDVFHRIHSPEGSLSINFAKLHEGFDLRTNFNIYTLEPETGKFDVVRAGHLDQPKMDIGE